MEYIITFKTTNSAIKSEQCLLGRQLRVGVLPLPSQIGAGCGICLRVSPDEFIPALDALTRNNIVWAEVFLRVEEKGRFIYTKMSRERLE